MTRAYQCANVPGPHLGKVATSASVAAAIKRAERPVLIVGSDLRHLDWAINLAKERNIPIVATAHVAGAMREKGVRPDREMGAIEITDALRAQTLCAAHQNDLADTGAPAEC